MSSSPNTAWFVHSVLKNPAIESCLITSKAQEAASAILFLIFCGMCTLSRATKFTKFCSAFSTIRVYAIAGTGRVYFAIAVFLLTLTPVPVYIVRHFPGTLKFYCKSPRSRAVLLDDRVYYLQLRSVHLSADHHCRLTIS